MKKLSKVYDYKLLRGEIIKKYSTIKSFSKEVLNITPTALARILNNKARFSQDAISLIVDKLDIPAELIGIYFFNQKSQENAQG